MRLRRATLMVCLASLFDEAGFVSGAVFEGLSEARW